MSYGYVLLYLIAFILQVTRYFFSLFFNITDSNHSTLIFFLQSVALVFLLYFFHKNYRIIFVNFT